MFPSVPHPSTLFKRGLISSSHRSSLLKVLSSKFAGSCPNSASLSLSEASGIVSGKFFVRLLSFSIKWLIISGVLGGIGASPGVATVSESGALSRGNAGLCTNGTLGIVEGTKLGFGFLKKLRSVPFFFKFAFLSRFALDSRQIFDPQCRFLRFSSPTVPQCMRVPQSGHSVYPSLSSVICLFKFTTSDN